jgi:hypothetical protein
MNCKGVFQSVMTPTNNGNVNFGNSVNQPQASNINTSNYDSQGNRNTPKSNGLYRVTNIKQEPVGLDPLIQTDMMTSQQQHQQQQQQYQNHQQQQQQQFHVQLQMQQNRQNTASYPNQPGLAFDSAFDEHFTSPIKQNDPLLSNSNINEYDDNFMDV